MNVLAYLWQPITGTITLAGVGLLAVIGWVTSRKKTAVDEEDEKGHREADRLIGILSKTVKQLEEDIHRIGNELHITKQELTRITNENQVITRILQGRDNSTEEYYKSGYEAMGTIKATHEIIVAMNQNFERLYTALENKAS